MLNASVSQCSRALRKNVTTFCWRTLDHAMGDFQIRNRHAQYFISRYERMRINCFAEFGSYYDSYHVIVVLFVNLQILITSFDWSSELEIIKYFWAANIYQIELGALN